MPIKLYFLFFKCLFTYKVMALISVLDVGVLPLVEKSVGIIFNIDVTNEDRQNICEIYSRCTKCCLKDSNREDCNVTIAFGEDIEQIKPRDRKSLLYVAPMLVQHDLDGYCEFLLNYNCNNTKEEGYVTIQFDTQVGVKQSKELLNQYVTSKKICQCETHDEDSLNNCEPVDCNVKYLDRRPIFDNTLNKCVEIPICLTNPDKELPDYVYVPNSNTCRNLELPLTVQDIYAISTGLGTVTMPPNSAIDLKIKLKSNCSTISENLNLIRDLMEGKLCPFEKGVTLDCSECLKAALFTIAMSVVSICIVLFLLVCCVNSIIWLYIQWSDGNLNVIWKVFKNPFKEKKRQKSKNDKLNTTIRNALLREVIVKDIPLELRNSVIDVCDRIGKEVQEKKRYRAADVGSQISLQKSRESLLSTTSSRSLEDNKE